MDQWTLIEGDSLQLLPDLCPNPAVIVTDPPYGTGGNCYASGKLCTNVAKKTIANDHDTAARDTLLAMYPDTPAVVFGAPHRNPPANTVQVLVLHKPPDAGAIAARAGFRRDIEGIYLVGKWPQGAPARSSIIRTDARSQGGQAGVSGRYGHPHAKPLDVLTTLIQVCPPGLILDPFAGSGTTLLAARLLDRPALGIEIDPEHVRTARRHLAQDLLV